MLRGITERRDVLEDRWEGLFEGVKRMRFMGDEFELRRGFWRICTRMFWKLFFFYTEYFLAACNILQPSGVLDERVKSYLHTLAPERCAFASGVKYRQTTVRVREGSTILSLFVG